jgi:hypothetical protein
MWDLVWLPDPRVYRVRSTNPTARPELVEGLSSRSQPRQNEEKRPFDKLRVSGDGVISKRARSTICNLAKDAPVP